MPQPPELLAAEPPADDPFAQGPWAAVLRRQVDVESRLRTIEGAVADNTAITSEIRDMIKAGRLATKLVKWAGAMAIAGSAVYAVLYQLTHNGRLPHQ